MHGAPARRSTRRPKHPPGRLGRRREILDGFATRRCARVDTEPVDKVSQSRKSQTVPESELRKLVVEGTKQERGLALYIPPEGLPTEKMVLKYCIPCPWLELFCYLDGS